MDSIVQMRGVGIRYRRDSGKGYTLIVNELTSYLSINGVSVELLERTEEIIQFVYSTANTL